MFPQLPSYVKNRARTRIVCTIGPATGDPASIRQLIRTGMSVARLNLSHGNSDEHWSYVNAIRQVSKETNVQIGILADLPGPKYRVGRIDPSVAVEKDGRTGVNVDAKASFLLTTEEVKTTSEQAMVWPAGLHKDVKPRSTILIDEGAVELRVDHVEGNQIFCTVHRGGLIQDFKAVTVPGNTSSLDYFTEETVKALNFAIEADVDYVGLSYIRNADDLIATRKRLQQAGRKPILISKIEIREAVANLNEILRETDAIMVARGDLGVEMPLHLVPTAQKRMIRMANEVGKPVITATQMLESMRDNPYPTRAEATDVYNAVRDGTDAVMLSAETSVGKYPAAAVRFMAQVSKRAEKFLETDMLRDRRMNIIVKQGRNAQVDAIIAYNAASTADQLRSRAIITYTESGTTAERVAAFRPRTPIIVLSPNTSTAARLSIRWGVTPITIHRMQSLNQMFRFASQISQELGYARDGDTIVVVAGLPTGYSGSTNLLRVIKIPEQEL